MLEVKDLKVERSGQPILHGISLTVGNNEIVGVLGPNGAGKTTLLRSISKLNPIKSGSVAFGEIDLIKLGPQSVVKAGIIHVPEGRQVFPKMTVLENLELGGFTKTRGEISNAVQQIFERFPILKDRKNQHAGLLSGGEQQLLVIARSLIAQPKLLMLDEPSLGLAPLIVAEIARIIEEIKKGKTSVLLVEQETHVVLELASHIFLLSNGEIVMSGPVEHFKERQQLMDAYLGMAISGK